MNGIVASSFIDLHGIWQKMTYISMESHCTPYIIVSLEMSIRNARKSCQE